MKKWLFFLTSFLAVALLGGGGPAGRDVAQLEPVQTIYLGTEGGQILLQTDTGAKGHGINTAQSLQDLQETARGFVFLDTADYLLVEEGQQHLILELEEVLRPSCRLCLVTEMPEMDKVGIFLQIHQPAVTLNDYLAGERTIQTLKTGEELRLVS